MSDFFYRQFEEKYRGSRELIKTRLRVYIPFIQPLLKAYPAGKALDAGCGRGEWLEILTEQGFDAMGVDLDDGMLQACRDLGFKVQTEDAIAHLKTWPDASICVVSGFHIAEHLSFKVLQELVQQAKRVLVPGGLLILETPNPENIVVGTCNFYLDPTHQRPIPPELLSFLPEHYGFARAKVLRLQESQHLHDQANISLLDVFKGVSPDYAVVAQKQGVPLLMEAIDSAFGQSHGLSLDHLATLYQKTFENRLLELEVRTQQAQEQALQAQEQALQAQEKAQQAKAVSQEHIAQLHDLYNSKSWRITAPLRWTMNQLRLLRSHGLKQRSKAAVKKLLKRSAQWVVTQPKLKNLLKKLAYKLGMGNRLRALVNGMGTEHQVPAYNSGSATQEQQTALSDSSKAEKLQTLTPRATQIYQDLKLAIEKNQKDGA